MNLRGEVGTETSFCIGEINKSVNIRPNLSQTGKEFQSG